MSELQEMFLKIDALMWLHQHLTLTELQQFIEQIKQMKNDTKEKPNRD